jgi:PPOX class probable F420-dependent enzyme
VTALDDDARRLLDAPNFAHLSTIQPSGGPKVDPVWVGREGDRILVATDAKSLKVRNVEADPRVALSIVAYDDPYDQLLVRGVVVELRPDDDLVVLDALSDKYLGTPFARRRWSKRLALVIEPRVVRAYRSSLRDPRRPAPDADQPRP